MIKNRKLLLVVIIIGFLAVFIPFLRTEILSIIHPPIGWNPSQLSWVSRVTNGQPLYLSEGKTFVEGMIPYSPMFYLLWGYLDKILGYTSLVMGMSLALFFTLLCCVPLYILTVKVTKDKVVSIIAPILFLTAYNVISWATSPSSDTLALLFTLIGMIIVWQYSSSKGILWSIPLFTLAVYTKQAYIVAPLTVGIYLLWKNKKIVIPFSVGFIISILVPFFIVNYYTHGQFFLHVIVFPTESTEGKGMIWSSVPNSILLMFGLNLVPLLTGLGCWIYNLFKKQVGLLEIWFLVAFLVMALLIGKPGSAWNYGLEWVSVSSILGCLLVKSVLGQSKSFSR